MVLKLTTNLAPAVFIITYLGQFAAFNKFAITVIMYKRNLE